MKSLNYRVVIFLGAMLVASSAWARDFDENQVSKKTKIGEFEFATFNDGTLWARALLNDDEAIVHIGRRVYDRTEPFQLQIAGYKAHEFFTLADQTYVTLTDSVNSNNEYLLPLKALRGRRIGTDGFLWNLVPSPLAPVGLIASYWMADVYPLSALGFAVAHVALWAANTTSAARAYLKSREHQVSRFEVVEAPYDHQRLRRKRYVHGPGMQLTDVILQNLDGREYSLRDLQGKLYCRALIDPR